MKWVKLEKEWALLIMIGTIFLIVSIDFEADFLLVMTHVHLTVFNDHLMWLGSTHE